MPKEIVRPRKSRNDPRIGPVAVMVAMENDVALMQEVMGVGRKAVSRIFSSSVYKGTCGGQDVTLVGPMLGAPQAVMILEKLIVLGAKRILFVGWCGSIQESAKIADFVVPDRAVIGEGTSMYYLPKNEDPRPSGNMVKAIRKSLKGCAIPCHTGPVWSTDAPYRETKQQVLSLQRKDLLGVDMEVSALFSAARFRHVEIGALLVVSDELGSLRWKPGFSSRKFHRSRKIAAEAVPAICRRLALCEETEKTITPRLKA
jgi:uridine phosphorylase